jgi:hypothetical protein
VNEITIKAEITPQEYRACGNASIRKGERIVYWAAVAIGAASSAACAALTLGTPASLLAALALAAFSFIYFLNRQITAARLRWGYKRFTESDVSYTFTEERIVTTWLYGQNSFAWVAVDRVIELKALYLLAVGRSGICVPKRDIPPDRVGDFIQLLTTHQATVSERLKA